jgi:hypothetical protein
VNRELSKKVLALGKKKFYGHFFEKKMEKLEKSMKKLKKKTEKLKKI